MIRLIKSMFNDLKFRGKLLLSHLIIALIPILLLGTLSFYQSYHAQMKELRMKPGPAWTRSRASSTIKSTAITCCASSSC